MTFEEAVALALDVMEKDWTLDAVRHVGEGHFEVEAHTWSDQCRHRMHATEWQHWTDAYEAELEWRMTAGRKKSA